MTVSGKKEVVSVKLSPDVVDPDDIEMLETRLWQLPMRHSRQMEAESSEAISKLTGGLGRSTEAGGFPFNGLLQQSDYR